MCGLSVKRCLNHLTSPTGPSEAWPCGGLQLKVETLSPSMSSFNMSSALSTMSFSWSMKISFSKGRMKPFSTYSHAVLRTVKKHPTNAKILIINTQLLKQLINSMSKVELTIYVTISSGASPSRSNLNVTILWLWVSS